MSALPQHSAIVIIGAGPAGLTTGLLLAEYGVASVILERNQSPMDIPRAIILDDEGARTLQCFGADETYVSQILEANGAEYIDDQGQTFGRVGSGAPTYGFPKRHYISQPELERALLDLIAATPLCDLRFGCEVNAFDQSEDNITLSVTNTDGSAASITADYVVAADGGRSPTREALGIKMTGSTYEQDWIVIDTLNDADQSRHSKFFCSVARPHVSIPAPNGGRRYEFMMLPGETPQDVLKHDFIAGLLAQHRELAPADILRKTVYTFHARIAEAFQKGRIFLIGDAAHLTPPFAGQGMNAGLRDASNLSWKLASVLKGTSENILPSYFDERNAPAWAMVQLAVVMGDIVMPIEPEKQAFRAQLLSSMAPFPGIQDYLLKMKFKPPPRFDQGLFLDLEDQPFEASLVGEMIPQPDVQIEGKSVKLDTLLGNGFALVAQDAVGAATLKTLAMTQLCGLPLRTVVLDTGSGVKTPNSTADPRAKSLRTHRDQLLLIRPDRYCAAAFAPETLEDALVEYAKVLGRDSNRRPVKPAC